MCPDDFGGIARARAMRGRNTVLSHSMTALCSSTGPTAHAHSRCGTQRTHPGEDTQSARASRHRVAPANSPAAPSMRSRTAVSTRRTRDEVLPSECIEHGPGHQPRAWRPNDYKTSALGCALRSELPTVTGGELWTG